MPVTINIEEDFLYNQGVEKGLQKGELQGKAEKAREAAINMLKMNCAVDFICEVLNVKEAYVLEIKSELNL